MYESPIRVLQTQMAVECENNILKCIQSFYPDINKDELVKALQYDRHQYSKGYADGAIEFADRLKKWFVENSNYWFSHTVNMEIDDVLKTMIGT